jgi:hypothetical protein
MGGVIPPSNLKNQRRFPRIHSGARDMLRLRRSVSRLAAAYPASNGKIIVIPASAGIQIHAPTSIEFSAVFLPVPLYESGFQPSLE